ncbi:phosphoglycerate mutase (2,3-diphosphoglycerate-independent) [Candidatus Falkowbacteria bacterium CG11_big_fil_rev_8_21_14_0_20_39_10]|uniref:2,3-bisphosphoglycerate-independent phosphoglycerate mutase n=1 Tax=Candidatus Falkowbacteria bacterium CG11_big_fil_rev_8_21_14_0_20_39_10 TaxID=1974570 RepID=A0A2M6KA76_9BACT|nr:MAG: phosphoglycerate mutase (2,3-diphosphoglycerate-independent) [Candidatus Falkowbacteria bacterium CG11_big_fil_rev_8_21_14_0_20_39_10]
MEKTVNTIKKPRPVVLVVLDGWGITQPYSGNAISQANTAVFNELAARYPSMTLRASGEAVGLPWGEMGNSEVGHLNLGLGRIVYQDLPRIHKAISDNTFAKNPALIGAIDHAKKNNSKLHLLGLVSDGGVHSSIDHLQALLSLAKEKKIKEVYIHAILDGRDTPYNSGINYIKKIERFISEYGLGKIATISGRLYAMDRNNAWDKIAKAYLAMTEGKGNVSEDPVKALDESYSKKIYDEEFLPTVIVEAGKPVAKVEKGDSLIFFNFRADRARQITKAFVLPGFEKIPSRQYLEDLFFVCFTEYEKNLPVEVAFGPEEITNTLGEVISNRKLRQLRIAETEKYAHVTYFFNGGREEKMPNEDHILVSSPQVASYDLQPEMSAPEIAKKLLGFINDDIYDFILVNFANPDMVGHTGNLKATIKAVEVADSKLGKIAKAVLNKGGCLLVTADHGNAEEMFNMQTGVIHKEHTTNPVPLIIVGEQFEGKTIGFQEAPGSDLSLVQPQGILSDVAPTILKIMGVDKPKEMTGRSLI